MIRAMWLLAAIVHFTANAEIQAHYNFSEFDHYAEQVLEKSKIPGAAIAIVQDGKILYAKGYGVKDIETKKPVTADTLFAIGSTTKAFTATAVGMLVDEGKVQFNKPVSQYVPEFRLKDPVATLNATPIDLMSHMTGMPRHDLAWYGYDSFPRSYFMSLLPHLEPSSGFREKWQYNNFMWMVMGYMVEKISGKTWEEFVRDRLLSPMKMSTSNFSVDESKAAVDFASPHSMQDKDVTVVPFRPIVGMGPAGSINSSVNEMAQWLILNLNQGQYEGTQLVKPGTMKYIHAPKAIIQGEYPRFPEFSQVNYSLGWMTQSYRGRKILWHNGGIDGFIAISSFMPNDNVGVVILTNGDFADITQPLAWKAYDTVLKIGDVDWYKKYVDAVPKESAEPGPEKNYEAPIRPLTDYVGDYSHPGYGTLTIQLNVGGELELNFHDLIAHLKHVRQGAFEFAFEAPQLGGNASVYFEIDGAGEIQAVRIPLEPVVEPIRFLRRK